MTLIQTLEPQDQPHFEIRELPFSPFHDAIVEAINNRRVISIRYDRDRLPRLYAPYLYRHAKNGNYNIVGMQIENPNSLDDNNVRRTFIVSKIKSLELTTEIFVPIDTFKPDEPSHSSGIIACVLPWNLATKNDNLISSV